MTAVVEIVEIDVPVCELTYGIAPCTAALGVTGTDRCYNTRRTCQDRANFDLGTLTLRFVRDTADYESYDGIPCLEDVSVTPAVIDPGVSLGERESVKITLSELLHSDVGIDPYVADRAYDPVSQGTFWARFRARVPSLRGADLRIYRGTAGDAIADLEVRHYTIEAGSGPSRERFTIVAKDPLKFLDGDRAQAPFVSRGVLAVGIDDVAGSLTLSPAGIGDIDYPASGKIAIGGREICSFTRTGDVMAIGRAENNTEAQSHDANDNVQLVLAYVGESPADVIYDLLTTYTDIDPSWIDLTNWQTEVTTWIGRLYTAEIAEPIAVRKLIDELIEQVGLIMWADLPNRMIRLTALRTVQSPGLPYTPDRMLAGSFGVKEQPDKRVSQIWTYIGLRNPLAEIDDRSNYRSVVVGLDDTGADEEYGDQPAVKKIYSRWISANNRPAAERLNELILTRYRDPPRLVSFSLLRGDTPPDLGRGTVVSHWEIQDEAGDEPELSVHVRSLEVTDDRYEVEAEELSAFSPPGNRIVTFDVDEFNVNLRDKYDEIYEAPGIYDEIVFIVSQGVKIGGEIYPSFPTSPPPGDNIPPAMDVGDWPPGIVPRLVIYGRIQGIGGRGGDGLDYNTGQWPHIGYGGPGGGALYARAPIIIENHGEIWGGAGGGAGSGGVAGDEDPGGGGAGYMPGRGGIGDSGSDSFWYGEDGTTEAGGAGILSGGTGGDPTFAGGNAGGSGYTGGAAGYGVDGDSYIVWELEGDIKGSRVN